MQREDNGNRTNELRQLLVTDMLQQLAVSHGQIKTLPSVLKERDMQLKMQQSLFDEIAAPIARL